MFVNVTGCFLIGFLMASLSNRFALNPGLRLFLTIGVLGGFTTYSTFSYETIVMLREAQRLAALSNITFTLLSCLTGTWLGMETGQLF